MYVYCMRMCVLLLLLRVGEHVANRGVSVSSLQVYRVGWVCASTLVTSKGAPDVRYSDNHHAPLQRSLLVCVYRIQRPPAPAERVALYQVKYVSCARL